MVLTSTSAKIPDLDTSELSFRFRSVLELWTVHVSVFAEVSMLGTGLNESVMSDPDVEY